MPTVGIDEVYPFSDNNELSIKQPTIRIQNCSGLDLIILYSKSTDTNTNIAQIYTQKQYTKMCEKK